MQERSENTKSFDGCELFFRIYTPQNEQNLKGFILVVHGFSEHSGRYLEVAKTICQKNMACVLFDNRGHGNSGPARGDTENLHALILDILFMQNHIKRILNLSEDSLLGLLGHSLGGLFVTFAAAHLGKKCPPLFLSSPCYKVKQHIPGWKKFLALKVSGIAPLLSAPVGIKFENISNNPKNNEAARKDKLFLSSMSARMGSMFLNAVDEQKILNSISMVSAPVVIAAAEDDKLVDVEVTKKYAPLFPNKKSELKILSGAGHEIFNEIDQHRNVAFRYLNQWLDDLSPV